MVSMPVEGPLSEYIHNGKKVNYKKHCPFIYIFIKLHHFERRPPPEKIFGTTIGKGCFYF